MKQKSHFVGRQLISIQSRQLIAIQDSALFIAFFLQLTLLIIMQTLIFKGNVIVKAVKPL